jgi:hypothetical protein
LILFELIYPLGTAMEKHERFAELRKGMIPKTFEQRFYSLSRLILQMTDIDINNRPDTGYIIQAIQNEILRLEGNTLGLDLGELVIQRERYFSFDLKNDLIKSIESFESDEESFIYLAAFESELV